MAKVYGYNVQTGDHSLFASEADWEDQLTVPGIKRYLNDHFRNQLAREVPVAVDAFKAASVRTGIGTGFWALARMVLAPISFLGALYRGSDSTDHAIEFLEEYIGRRQNRPEYLATAALLFVMYRHGLIHTSMPKVIERDAGLIVGWGVTLAPSGHLTRQRGANSVTILLSPEQLYLDLVQAIDLYAADFDGGQQAELVRAFKAGYLTMATADTLASLRVSAPTRAKIVTYLNTL